MDMTRKLAVRKRKCRSVLRSIPGHAGSHASKGLSACQRRSERRRSRKHAATEKRLEIPKIPGETRKIMEDPRVVSSGVEPQALLSSKQMAPDPSEFIALNNPHWRQWYILY